MKFQSSSRTLWTLRIFFLIFLSSSIAESAATTEFKNVVSWTGITLTSSTTQGGQGPSGSSFLSHTEYVYGKKYFGLGVFYQLDLQGSAQTDTALGPKLEIRISNLYLEYDYAVQVKRAFTDRSIANQTGDGSIFGAGIRFRIGGKWLFQASYKYRSFTIKKQDGIELTQAIVQKDGYPAVGFGYDF